MDIVDDEFLARLSKINKIEQVINASNEVFLLTLDSGEKFVFKPSLGERPLWDFPSGSLYLREYFTSIIFTQLGIKVPKSYLLSDSPLGSGLLMDFIEVTTLHITEICPRSMQLDDSWISAISGTNMSDEEITLWHKDINDLRLIALGDLVVNNADRKINHIVSTGSNLVALDHGLTFHYEPKLRTFLWGWKGKKFKKNEINLLESLLSFLETKEHAYLISDVEYKNLLERIQMYLNNPEFPYPPTDRPALPWPIY